MCIRKWGLGKILLFYKKMKNGNEIRSNKSMNIAKIKSIFLFIWITWLLLTKVKIWPWKFRCFFNFWSLITISEPFTVILNKYSHLIYALTLTRPLRRKLRMTWFFDVSKVKESSFFLSDLTDPLRFLMRIFWQIRI